MYISRWRLLRWRHVYKAIWEAGIAEELEYRRKIGNRVDRCAVAVVIIATVWSVMYRGIFHVLGVRHMMCMHIPDHTVIRTYRISDIIRGA